MITLWTIPSTSKAFVLTLSSFIEILEARCKRHGTKLRENEQWVIYGEIHLSLDDQDLSEELVEKLALVLENNDILTSLSLCRLPI